MQDLKSALDKADGKAPGPNHVEARFIKALPAPVQWLLVHSYRAILRGEFGVVHEFVRIRGKFEFERIRANWNLHP